MYVCLCNTVTDHDIRKWKENYPQQSDKEACEKLGIGKNCGLCKREALRCLNEEKKTSGSNNNGK